MLKLENVHIRRGDYVVADSIDLTLEQGKVYSVLGPNGTGKSSLMKTIFGEVAHKGTIHYGDEVLSKIHLQSWRKRIGYMPQDTAAEASLAAWTRCICTSATNCCTKPQVSWRSWASAIWRTATLCGFPADSGSS